MIELFLSGEYTIAGTDDASQRFFQAGDCIVAPYDPKNWRGTWKSSASAVAYELAKKGTTALVLGFEDDRHVFVVDNSVIDATALDSEARQIVVKPGFYQIHEQDFPDKTFRQFGIVHESAKLLFAPDILLSDPPKYCKREKHKRENNAYHYVLSSLLRRNDDSYRGQKLANIIKAFLNSDSSVLDKYREELLWESAAFHSTYDGLADKVRGILAEKEAAGLRKDLMHPVSGSGTCCDYSALFELYKTFCAETDSDNQVATCVQATLSANINNWYSVDEITDILSYFGDCSQASWWKTFRNTPVFPLWSVSQLGSIVSPLIALCTERKIPAGVLLSLADDTKKEVPLNFGALGKRIVAKIICLKK